MSRNNKKSRKGGFIVLEEDMKRFDIDRLMEDWIIPLAVIGAIVTLILLYIG